MRWVQKTCLTNLSGTSLAIWLATTWPLGVLIRYGALVIISNNFAFLAHAELMKSCDALESTGAMTRCTNSKNVPASMEYLRSWCGWHTTSCCWGPELASLLIYRWCWGSWCVALLGFTTLPSKVPDTFAIETRGTDYCSLLGWARWYRN
jgi:hypothetical protein